MASTALEYPPIRYAGVSPSESMELGSVVHTVGSRYGYVSPVESLCASMVGASPKAPLNARQPRYRSVSRKETV